MIGSDFVTFLQLKYFVKICNNGSFSLGAKELFLTQPALSSAISNLEKEFDIKLFERKKYNLVLTKAGEFFYDRAKIILESVDIFESELRNISKNQVTIRIGVPPMIGSFLFPKIYNKYLLNHVGAKFEIWEEGSLGIRKKILNKTLDIGFSILNDSENEHYNREVLLETQLLYCVSKSNKLSDKESLNINDIKNEPIVLMREGSFQTRLINNMFSKIGTKPNIVLVSSQISILRNFAKMDLGGAFLIKELVDPNDDTIIGIPFENELSLKIGLLWQKNIELSSAAKEFIKYIKNTEV
jgi:DNA-binding transcriptional LysR family regulator